jgi:cell wall-associated NlpC family hydrolase
MKIDDLIGKPFEPNGRGPDTYDCFGLFAELCHRRGVEIPVIESPDGPKDCAGSISASVAKPAWKKLDAPQPGCAVLIRFIPPYVSHIGMVLDCGARFIHTRQGAGVTVERLDSIAWRSRIAGYYSHVH